MKTLNIGIDIDDTTFLTVKSMLKYADIFEEENSIVENDTASIQEIFADKEETIDENEAAFVTSEPVLEETVEEVVEHESELWEAIEDKREVLQEAIAILTL